MIEAKVTERKLLSEECWIDVGNDIQLRIDYPTHSQSTEQRRLEMLWFNKMARPDTEHWIEYYIRCTVREVRGFSIEGKAARLVLERGIADHLTNADPARPNEMGKNLDVIAVFVEFDMLESLCGMILQRLEMNEMDKKKLQSQDSLSEMESLGSPMNNSELESKSLTDGIQLIPLAEKIS